MLMDQIDAHMKSSMKEKNTIKLNTLRMVKAAIKNKMIEKKTDSIDDSLVLDIIQKQVKQRKDSVEQFKKGNRNDLVEQETQELLILESYLPKQLSDDELKSIVQKTIEATGAKSKADMGRIMKEAMAQAKGRADGKRLSQMVSSLLQ